MHGSVVAPVETGSVWRCRNPFEMLLAHVTFRISPKPAPWWQRNVADWLGNALQNRVRRFDTSGRDSLDSMHFIRDR